jgi:hypothetical protein
MLTYLSNSPCSHGGECAIYAESATRQAGRFRAHGKSLYFDIFRDFASVFAIPRLR